MWTHFTEEYTLFNDFSFDVMLLFLFMLWLGCCSLSISYFTIGGYVSQDRIHSAEWNFSARSHLSGIQLPFLLKIPPPI